MLETEKIETPKYWLPFVAAGAGFCLLILCSTFYFLTRPCVILKCSQIDRAEKYALRSEKILQQPRSTKNFVAAYEDIEKAIALLESIPVWSDRYLDIKNSLTTYQTRRETLKNLVTALELRAAAIERAKNSPFAVSQWQEIELLWYEAIAALEAVPKNSEYYSFARRKIAQYRQKLADTNKRINLEKTAVASLENAKKRAVIARATQDDASSLTDWKLAHSHWELAVKTLEHLPEGTTVDRAAKELKTNLLPELELAQRRRDLEEIAVNNYQQATRSAKLAIAAEEDKQWTEAVKHWQTALNSIKSVQENTFQSRRARLLIGVYRDALNSARKQRHLALRIKQATIDLEKTCSEIIRICNFTVTDDAIEIRFTSDYIQQVQQTALQAKARGKIEQQVKVMEHILSLEAALKTITNNAGIKVKLYNPENTLLLTYIPEK